MFPSLNEQEGIFICDWDLGLAGMIRIAVNAMHE